MSRAMTNDDVMSLFKKVEEMRSSNQSEKDIRNIHSKIVEGLSFLVYSHTKQYRKFPNYEDLVQEGFVGLIKAVRKFNYTLFPNFFVYADRWIKHSVKRAASRFDVVYNPNRNRVVYAEPAESEEEIVEDTPEEIFFSKERSNRVETVLGELSDRDSEIVKRIFGIGEYSPQTLREIGPIFNLTHERIRQIKNDAISKLKKNGRLNEVC